MDIYDPGLMAGSNRADGTSTPTNSNSDQPKTELDQNVEKLVGNISNWWSGFAKKSQDSINQARKEMENRGGIVNYAKSEYAKLESSIGEAQKKARDQSQTSSTEPPADPSLDDTAVFSSGATAKSENSKGKQRAMDEPSPAAAEAATASDQGPTLGASVSSLFSKLTSDPRLVQLQHSLTSTLQSVSSPQGEPKEAGDKTTASTPINIQESLSKLSLTIQSHLPHLDLKESQQLATRYLHATESFAREMQSDMKEFVGELVRIVPPEGEGENEEGEEEKKADAGRSPGEEGGKNVSATEKATPTTEVKIASEDVQSEPKETSTAAVSALAPTEDEEDFAWDEDDEEAAAASGEATLSVALEKKEDVPASTTASVDTETKPAEKKAPEESEDDSDWE
ncbi:uncharacterized protein UTRI_01184_B [Ustilago trichophora]|uniref:BSD domain-containing protein n=1 Tax=Ustilago trichophora TaxID=86804 RepID=A0A5C3DWR8_9BASI|nr:uncharacterized protein UTRI_01184_B [Ustilago trichophora]